MIAAGCSFCSQGRFSPNLGAVRAGLKSNFSRKYLRRRGLGHLLGGPTDTGSTDTQGPRDGNAGKKSSRSRMRGLLDLRKPGAFLSTRPRPRAKPGSHRRKPPRVWAAGPNVYGDSEFHLPPPLSTGNAQVWSHRSAAVSCPMPCSCSSAPSPVPSGPR